MRIAVDMGGTFTDLVLEDTAGRTELFKAATTPSDPLGGILACMDLAASASGVSRSTLLAKTNMFVHGTTRALNAILTGTTARTAFVTTAGHRDILLFREGGRTQPFNHAREYPDPYVPRRLTYEIEERIGPTGRVIVPLDRSTALEVMRRLDADQVEAIGVCLLWSVLNPVHELQVAALLEEYLPGVPYTLSHQLNPSVREYRRASSTCIDASLKPVMSHYLSELDEALRTDGFSGRLLIVSSAGGVLDVTAARDAPIHSVGSGPAMAPVAGRHFAASEGLGNAAVVVTDTGGTSFDISLVRNGAIPWTRETWIGGEYTGDITGFPSVDVRSIGAGGGSIAWVDDGGLLRVGPQSAGADPGPACYARGGSAPTVTDACVVLGFLDPEYFLGGSLMLDAAAARRALEQDVGARLGVDPVGAAWSVLSVATEEMIRAIEETTVYRGIDPVGSVLVGGGGAAGFNIVAIARRLGCRSVLIPKLGPGLSAAGGLLSNLVSDYAAALPTSTDRFDFVAVNAILETLRQRCAQFRTTSGAGADDVTIELFAEARYPDQVWELEIPLAAAQFASGEDVERLRQDFHTTHVDLFGVADPDSRLEIISWRARVTCRLHASVPPHHEEPSLEVMPRARKVFFGPDGWTTVSVVQFASMTANEDLRGPALVDAPQTTVVIYPGAVAHRTSNGNLMIDFGAAEEA